MQGQIGGGKELVLWLEARSETEWLKLTNQGEKTHTTYNNETNDTEGNSHNLPCGCQRELFNRDTSSQLQHIPQLQNFAVATCM